MCLMEVECKGWGSVYVCRILFGDGSLVHENSKIVSWSGGVVWRCACGNVVKLIYI